MYFLYSFYISFKGGGFHGSYNALWRVIYPCQVSTDKQEELSPDAQRRLLLDYAKAHNIFISPDLIFTENGISGRKADKRPEFQKMISIAKSDTPPFSVILVWKFSRFARNQEESIVYKSMLKKQHGVDVVSITEPLIEGPFGSLIERIIEWMDEYYSINLSTETLRGMTEKAMRGGYQSTPSLGYRSPGYGQPFVIVPEEAEIVKYIFDQYVNAHRDPTSIARSLNRRHLLTKRGNPFEQRAIKYILHNQFYIGKIIWNGIEQDGVHETFISPELFQQAADRLETTYHPRNRRNVSTCSHWLSGLVKCSICGASLGYNRGKYPSMHCWKKDKGVHENSSNISVRKLEEGVLDYFRKLLDGEDFTFSYHSSAQEEPDPTILYQKELDKMQGRENRIREAYEAGIDTLEEYKQRKQLLAEERKRLLSLIAASKSEEKKQSCTDKEQILLRVRNIYELLLDPDVDYETKGVFMRSIVEKIIWNKAQNTLSFFLYMPEKP